VKDSRRKYGSVISAATSVRFDVKDVTLDPVTMFDRSISRAAHRTGNRPCSDRSANFRDSLRSSFPACF
jgi:hypothetical protein